MGATATNSRCAPPPATVQRASVPRTCTARARWDRRATYSCAEASGACTTTAPALLCATRDIPPVSTTNINWKYIKYYSASPTLSTRHFCIISTIKYSTDDKIKQMNCSFHGNLYIFKQKTKTSRTKFKIPKKWNKPILIRNENFRSIFSPPPQYY